MIPLEDALRYAARGWPVFPCQWQGPRRKSPLTRNGLTDATTDLAAIEAWWRKDPLALIGVPTGKPIGCVVLDIDRKNGVDGLATYGKLDCPILPPVPTARTSSGGFHLYFERPSEGLRNTNGSRGRGIGPGLDWRGDGGYVILPSARSGYRWDHWTFENTRPRPIPPPVLPREPVRQAKAMPPVRPETGLTPYASAALDHACRRIQAAPNGEQEATLHAECFSIGTLAGAGAIPAGFARRSLHWAASRLPSYDRARPWGAAELARKIDRSFDEGRRHPRVAHA